MPCSHLHDLAGAGRGPAGRRAQLERVLLASAEREPDHLLEAVRAHPDVPVRVELVDVLVARAVLGVEQPEVPDVEDAVVGNRRRDDVPVVRGEVDDSPDRPVRPDPVDRTVVRLDRVERALGRDHAVPGAVRLEVGRRVRHGVRLDEGAQVGDHRPAGPGDAEDLVRDSRHAV